MKLLGITILFYVIVATSAFSSKPLNGRAFDIRVPVAADQKSQCIGTTRRSTIRSCYACARGGSYLVQTPIVIEEIRKDNQLSPYRINRPSLNFDINDDSTMVKSVINTTSQSVAIKGGISLELDRKDFGLQSIELNGVVLKEGEGYTLTNTGVDVINPPHENGVSFELKTIVAIDNNEKDDNNGYEKTDNEEGSSTEDSNDDNEKSSVSSGMVAAIGIYKNFISPLLPPACRFVPTCSQYGVQAIEDFGATKGAVLTAWRLLRCSPFGGRGYDPPKWPPVFYTYGSY